MSFTPSGNVDAILNQIDHPIIDSDGHQIEYLPLVRDFIAEDAGEDVGRQFDQDDAFGCRTCCGAVAGSVAQLGWFSSGVWGLPTRNTLDRATAMLPELMYRRLDESASISPSFTQRTGS